jgi:FkbM family methyltransferase
MPSHKKLFEALDLPVLTALLADASLKLVDIGGRGSAFTTLVPLAPFADYYVSEPDAAEAERLKQQLPREAPWRTVTVLTEALASHEGEATLYVTSQPGMSSLLEPDADVARQFYLNDKFRVVETTTVPTLPLDEAAARYGFADACFLKIDTQGSELDILRSGPRLVRESLLGVYVECSFRPFYKSQALFADVDAFLRQSGLALFSLSRTNLRRAGYRTSVYSKRVTTWAHCLYLREPEALARAGGETLHRDFARLLGLAVAFQHYDLALEMTALARSCRLLPEGDLSRLADEVERCAAVETRHMMRKAEGAGLADAVMAASFRDRKQLD